ncbi:hypothetical protein BIV57_05025 [Mangrovactinospora gilvigrisea]|uniref:HTH marR-type domain-containing protein n=1 Tax=Mangrovactinospora gilvigrisea TaxID=1428644 RepID=A0A1J7CAU3_9ACTN|nr:hypothetical protein BIV57_05025 [Mangrovactinospora gilvigrisea]
MRLGRMMASARQHFVNRRGSGDRILLGALASLGDRRTTDLAAAVMLDASAVSRGLHSLQQRGLVARRPDPNDGRGALLTITEAGRAQWKQYQAERDAKLDEVLTDWPEADRETLAVLLHRLNDDLAAHQHQLHQQQRGTTI